MPRDRDAELAQQTLADGGRRHARGRLTRGGALEDVARVGAIVLEQTRKIGVAGPDAGDGALSWRGMRACGRVAADFLRPQRRIHDLLPVLPIAILYQHRDRRAECLAGADAGEEFNRVLLDLHPSPARVALLTARELVVDVVRGERQPGGHALEDAHEGGSVRFTGGSETNHCASSCLCGGGSDNSVLAAQIKTDWRDQGRQDRREIDGGVRRQGALY